MIEEKEVIKLDELVEGVRGELKESSPELLSEFDVKIAEASNGGEIARVIQEVLIKKGYNVEKIVEKFIELAENAVASDGRGGTISNDYVKLQALTKLAEMAGLYKKKNVEIKTNFLQVIYGDEE